MNKQSFWLVLFQAINLVITFFTTFYIAGHLPSELYAVISITTVVSSILASFSFTGIENYVARNYLYWKESNKMKYARIMTTNAIFYRYLFSLVLLIPIFIYVYYISVSKFNGEYLVFFIYYSVLCTLSVVVDVMNIILRSQNRFVAAGLYTLVGSFIQRVLTLIVFILCGFDVFLFCYGISTVLIFMLQYKEVRKNFSIKFIIPVPCFFRLLKSHRHLLYSSYVSFFSSSFDNFVVSLLLRPELIGSYNIIKRIYSIARSTVDYLVDPTFNLLIKYKANIKQQRKQFKEVNKVYNVIIATLLVGFVVFYLGNDWIINLLGITHYPYIREYSLFAYLAVILYVVMKLRYDISRTLDTEVRALTSSIMWGAFNVVSSLIVFGTFNDPYVFLSLVISNTLMYLYLRLSKCNIEFKRLK